MKKKPPYEPPNEESRPTRIGSRHLRVGLELDGETLRVTSMWQVDQPVVQLDRFAKDLLVRVDVPGLPPYVEAIDDPRTARGAYRDDRGHAHVTMDSGVFYVQVPFVELDDLRDVRIRATPIAGLDFGRRDRDLMTAVFDDPKAGLRQVFEIDTKGLRAHPSWGAIRGVPGAAEPEGKFEVFRGEGGEYRWRLVRFPGEEVACSCRGYASREECLADLGWVRNHARGAPVHPLDLLGGADKSGEPTVRETPSEPRKPEDEESY